MHVNIVPIGNSKGIRIPQSLLKICHIEREVNLDVKGNTIMIRPLKRLPRNGWNEAFETMHRRKEDRLLMDDRFDLDLRDWEW